MSRRPTDTRQKILSTTTSLFSNHGFRATSIDDILSAVGITKGAFYHYFKSKNHLCEIILDEAISEYRLLAQTLQARQLHSNPLQQWLEMLIEKQLSGQWVYYSLLIRLSIESTELNASIQNKLKMFWQWCQGFHETLIKATLPPAAVSSVNTSGLARLYLNAHFGAVWLDRCAPAPQDLTATCETLLRLSLKES